jgi:FAD:protein FMN transferase
MKRRYFLRSSLGAGTVGLAASAGLLAGDARGADPLQWRESTLLGFGTVLSLRVGHADSNMAERALDAAVETIRHVEAQMSLFNRDSALSRLNREGVLWRPHPDLVQVLQL